MKPINSSQTQAMEPLSYCGAQALFNRDFIPERVYNQRRHLAEIDGLLFDCQEDQHPSLSIVTGIKGTGKNLLMNQIRQNARFEHKETIFFIDCENKTISQVLFAFLSQIMTLLKMLLNPTILFTMTDKDYWTHIQRYYPKLTQPLTVLFNSAEFLDKKYLLKFIDFSQRTAKLNLVLGYNLPGNSLQILDIYSSDYKCDLNKYSQRDLFHITKDRCDQAFDVDISHNTISYIVDMIDEFGQQTPGACIDYLKELYPKAMESQELDAETCRLISQYCLSQHSLTTLSLADFLMECDVLDRLVLDNCISTFKQEASFYLSFHQLEECYTCGCETLEYEFSQQEFHDIIRLFSQNMIIMPSPLQLKTVPSLDGIFPVDHFLTLPIDEITELLDVCFGDLDFGFGF